jgi:hypothetical protein
VVTLEGRVPTPGSTRASVDPPEQTLGEHNKEDQWRRNLNIFLAGLHT